MDQSSDRIWDMARQPLIEKLHHCVNLYKMYQGKFHEIKQKIEENPDEKPFEFSEMYIFGKFEAFCKRLDRVTFFFFFFKILSHILRKGGFMFDIKMVTQSLNL